MANKKLARIEKLSDTSLENVSGGGKVLSLSAKENVKTAGEAVAAVGLLGFGVCKIVNSVCEVKGIPCAKYVDMAGNICAGLAALGGATYLGGELG